MVGTIGQYYRFWSHGDAAIADKIFAQDCVHQDIIWGGGRELVVGLSALKTFVSSTRKAYPDIQVEAVDLATADLDHGGRVFCQWQGTATNLGPYHGHKPTSHASILTGVSIFHFADDHEHMTKIEVWRSPLAEDKHEMDNLQENLHGLHELHLHRLM